LSIGWGHNDAAYEISRTRGGCAALLTMNAFSTGSNSLVAAQGLQELLRLRGCQEDSLPVVDALRNVVNALTPIMEDSGFQSVLEAIHLAIVAELGRIVAGSEFEEERGSLMEDSGTPKEWADAVHHLYLTATAGQTIYLYTRTRAAWLAAFAVRLLEMDCAIMYHNHVLWEAAGRNGSVSIQIAFSAPKTRDGFARYFALDPSPEPIETIPCIVSTLLLKDALSHKLDKIPRLSFSCKQSIKITIVQLITFLSTRKFFVCPSLGAVAEVIRITGPFKAIGQRVLSGCEALGLDIPYLYDEILLTVANVNRGTYMQVTRGKEASNLLAHDKDEIERICYCDEHKDDDTKMETGFQYFLEKISNIIAGFATTSLALLPCHLETFDIRVFATVINGSSLKKKWAYTCIKSFTDQSARVNLEMLLTHLRRLFHGEDATELSKSAVAVSERGVTIAIRALLDSEGFNNVGQYIGIYSSRLSHNGCIRNLVEDSPRWVGGGQSHNLLMPWKIAPGVRFIPPNSEIMNNLEVRCQVKTKPESFEIHCDLTVANQNRRALTAAGMNSAYEDIVLLESQDTRVFFSAKLHDTIYTLLACDIGRNCPYNPASPFVIPQDDIFQSIEGGVYCVNPSDALCALVSSHGSRSRQLLSLCVIQGAFCSFLQEVVPCCLLLQEKACLACAFERTRVHIQKESPSQRGLRKYGAAAVVCNSPSSSDGFDASSVRPVTRPPRRWDILGMFPFDHDGMEQFREASENQERQRQFPRLRPSQNTPNASYS
jgi:hypothetical protein